MVTGCSILTAGGEHRKTVPSAMRCPTSTMDSNVVSPFLMADMSADVYYSGWLQTKEIGDIVAKYGVNRRSHCRDKS